MSRPVVHPKSKIVRRGASHKGAGIRPIRGDLLKRYSVRLRLHPVINLDAAEMGWAEGSISSGKPAVI